MSLRSVKLWIAASTIRRLIFQTEDESCGDEEKPGGIRTQIRGTPEFNHRVPPEEQNLEFGLEFLLYR